MKQNDLSQRVEQLERLVSVLLKADAPRAILITTLSKHFDSEWFTSGEAWSAAQDEPDLNASLRRCGINSAHGLGRWLAANEGFDVERGESARTGNLWRVCGFK